MLFAMVRFHLSPKRERNYPFREVTVQLFGVVTTLTGVASLCLDAERAARVAQVLEPFSVLPERLTPVGIYQFCRGLQGIGQEHQVSTYTVFDELIKRFEDPRYYPTLPAEARRLYWTGAHSARGSFAVMRADRKGALESAAALDSSGLKLYAMMRVSYGSSITRTAGNPAWRRLIVNRWSSTRLMSAPPGRSRRGRGRR